MMAVLVSNNLRAIRQDVSAANTPNGAGRAIEIVLSYNQNKAEGSQS
jgi:hypothetical protein